MRRRHQQQHLLPQGRRQPCRGQAFVVDTGESSFTASDANTECAKRTEAVDLDLKEGDRYVLYAYGTSLEDRQLLPVKIGD